MAHQPSYIMGTPDLHYHQPYSNSPPAMYPIAVQMPQSNAAQGHMSGFQAIQPQVQVPQSQRAMNTGSPPVGYFPPQPGFAPPGYSGAPISPYQRNNQTPSPNLIGRSTPDQSAPTRVEDFTNVFVASLPNCYDDKMLLELFQPFGSIVSAKVSRDLTTGNSRSFGFVRFAHAEAAAHAISDLHNAKVKGAGNVKLHVVLSNHTENKGATECDRLYVRNLPSTATSEDLIRIFSPYGKVIEANIQGNSHQATRGSANMFVGFIRMASVEEAKNALTNVHNTRPLDPNSPILVRYMESPDMKMMRRTKNTETASGRTSANRSSPDPFSGSSSSHPGGHPPAYSAPPQPQPQQQQQQAVPFPSYGDLYLQGAASEAIAHFVLSQGGHTVSHIAFDGAGYYIRLTDPSQHERAALEFGLVNLSDGSTVRVVTLVPPSGQQLPQPQSTLGLSQNMPMLLQPQNHLNTQ